MNNCDYFGDTLRPITLEYLQDLIETLDTMKEIGNIIPEDIRLMETKIGIIRRRLRKKK